MIKNVILCLKSFQCFCCQASVQQIIHAHVKYLAAFSHIPPTLRPPKIWACCDAKGLWKNWLSLTASLKEENIWENKQMKKLPLFHGLSIRQGLCWNIHFCITEIITIRSLHFHLLRSRSAVEGRQIFDLKGLFGVIWVISTLSSSVNKNIKSDSEIN